MAHFQAWGNVLDIYFPGKKGLKRVNYCFVTFDNWRAAQRACAHSARAIGGRVRLVDIPLKVTQGYTQVAYTRRYP